MKDRLLFILAVIFHPIWLPVLIGSLLFSYPLSHTQVIVRFGLISLLFPFFWIAIAKIKYTAPSLHERRQIFLILLFFYILAAIAGTRSSVNLGPWFSLHAAGMLVLYLINLKWKASWHVFGWALSATFLILKYRVLLQTEDLVDTLILLIFLGFVMTLGVALLRKYQNAHSWKELGIGLAAAIVVAVLFYTCMKYFIYGF